MEFYRSHFYPQIFQSFFVFIRPLCSVVPQHFILFIFVVIKAAFFFFFDKKSLLYSEEKKYDLLFKKFK